MSVQFEEQAAVGGSLCSSLDQPRGLACNGILDGAASECSTIFDSQEFDLQHNDDNLNDCLSTSGADVESANVETLLIYDWDDTLFPTTWIRKHALLEAREAGTMLSSEQTALLASLADRASLTLQKAIQIGKVVIVTNAEQGWVETSSRLFMPSLIALLNAVDVVSARSTYEQRTHHPSEWKRLAFEHEVELFYGSSRVGEQRNIVSFGDSMHELNALMAVTKGIPNCCGKSIKFLDAPSPKQLMEQHELLAESFLDIVEHNGDLDVEIGTDNSA